MKKMLFAILLFGATTCLADSWMYFERDGIIRIHDQDTGEIHFMHYNMSRGLMRNGHRAMVDGHTVWQVRLDTGEWIDTYPL